MGLCKTRWTGAGRMHSDNKTIIFWGGVEHKRDAALMLDKNSFNCILGYRPVSDCLLLVRLQGKPFNILIIQAYNPTSDATKKEIKEFYKQLHQRI